MMVDKLRKKIPRCSKRCDKRFAAKPANWTGILFL